MSNWKRYLFYSDHEDPRPMKFPPPGPYWITGYGENSTVLVAYLAGDENMLHEYWPEAYNITAQDAPKGPEFSDRFPQPDWFTPTR